MAQEYFLNIEEELSFTHNVSTNEINYYVSFVSFKKTANKFDGDKVEKFKKLFVEYDLAEDWREFKFRIDKAPTLSDFDFELVVFSTRDKVKLIF